MQALLALLLVGGGIYKLITPLATLWPWASEHPGLLRATSLLDVAGGLGLVLPMLTRIKPGLTVLAALGCAVLQLYAIVFHFSRGEAANTPFNFFILALALFVCWGRRSMSPSTARTTEAK
ncbi:MAG: DoxX family protein [Janthinobacterium lividum]